MPATPCNYCSDDADYWVQKLLPHTNSRDDRVAYSTVTVVYLCKGHLDKAPEAAKDYDDLTACIQASSTSNNRSDDL